VAHAEPEVKTAFSVKRLPTLFVLDAKGNVSCRLDGYDARLESKLTARLNDLLQ
jgi:hypothetical protein